MRECVLLRSWVASCNAEQVRILDKSCKQQLPLVCKITNNNKQIHHDGNPTITAVLLASTGGLSLSLKPLAPGLARLHLQSKKSPKATAFCWISRKGLGARWAQRAPRAPSRAPPPAVAAPEAKIERASE